MQITKSALNYTVTTVVLFLEAFQDKITKYLGETSFPIDYFKIMNQKLLKSPNIISNSNAFEAYILMACNAESDLNCKVIP